MMSMVAREVKSVSQLLLVNQHTMSGLRTTSLLRASRIARRPFAEACRPVQLQTRRALSIEGQQKVSYRQCATMQSLQYS